MDKPMDINFGNLSDREIAECLYKAYGVNLVRYAIKSWQQDEDDAWEILYDTLYGFINSYSTETFDSEKQVGALVWKIFRNKLRDKLLPLKLAVESMWASLNRLNVEKSPMTLSGLAAGKTRKRDLNFVNSDRSREALKRGLEAYINRLSRENKITPCVFPGKSGRQT